jgi:hypothetical protein
MFYLQQKDKRRGWDSNPRDGFKPPTRFPVALLRPTRTPLLKTPPAEFIKQSTVSVTPHEGCGTQRRAARAGNRRLVVCKLLSRVDCTGVEAGAWQALPYLRKGA